MATEHRNDRSRSESDKRVPALMPPLLSIVSGFLNIGIEVLGPPGLGKSTVAQWAASIWGGDPTRLTRFPEPWATTVNALEPTIRAHSYALLGLDELNLIGSLDDREVRRQLENAVFRLCYGSRNAGTASPSDLAQIACVG
jgi:uncharacterized protein (DUF927 family)